jgi:hypothetical protein
MSELCGTIIKADQDKPLTGKEIVQRCRQEVLETCGIDISVVLQEQVRLGQNVKQILDEIRSLNGSLCLKYNYGVAPWKLGVPHRISVNVDPSNPSKTWCALIMYSIAHALIRLILFYRFFNQHNTTYTFLESITHLDVLTCSSNVNKRQQCPVVVITQLA